MPRWSEWDRAMTYQAGEVVRYGPNLWRAVRAVTGIEPGSGDAWVAVVVIQDKQTMARALDERIGRGL